MAVDGARRVYVADTENHCIRRVVSRAPHINDTPHQQAEDATTEPDGGLVETVAGRCGEPGSDDGPGFSSSNEPGEARFSSPSGIGACERGKERNESVDA